MANVKVEVYETTISRDFQPGGQVWNNTFRLSRVNQTVAKNFAPVRTGNMRAGIDSYMMPSGVFTCGYEVRADALYSGYVHEGVIGPIYSSRPGGAMLVRPAPFSHYAQPTLRKKVRGQRANPFLDRSIIATFAAQGLL